MILNTISFKNVKRNENYLKKKKIQDNKKKFIKPLNHKSNSDKTITTINTKSIYNNIPTQYKNKIIRNNTYTNIFSFNNNVNRIISDLKNPNKKTELSTDFNSNIRNTNNISYYSSYDYKNKKKRNYSFSKKNKRKNYYSKAKNKISEKNLENIGFSILLKKQEYSSLKKGKRRIVKSSYQIPYIIKKKSINKKFNFIGLYNANIDKESKLKKEINNLMILNQNINLKKSKSISLKKNKLLNQEYKKINNNINNEKILNIKIKFSYQRKKDKFIEKNRLLMRQNYFKKILEEKISIIEKNRVDNNKKLKYLNNKIDILKTLISHFKINNIINYNVKLLNIIIEKNEHHNSLLIEVIKKYNNEIDKLKMNIKMHKNKRKEIFLWYELISKIKGDIPKENNNNNYNYNYNDIVNYFTINDLSKGFDRLAEKIIFLENNYKLISDEIFLLNNQKNLMNKEYQQFYVKDQKIIKESENELNILKEINIKRNNIKNNVINKKVNDILNIEKYNKDLYFNKDNKNIMLMEKIGKIFENYLQYLYINEYFIYEEKEKIKKIESEIIIKNKKNNNIFKIEKIKKYFFDIIFIIEKFINNIILEINKQKQKIGKENYKKIVKDSMLIKYIEKKLNILNDKEDKNEIENNIIKKENKIDFLPIKKVYIPYLAIKKENNDLKINNNSFNYENNIKYKHILDSGENKNKKNKFKKDFFYLDDDGIDKYNELFFE